MIEETLHDEVDEDLDQYAPAGAVERPRRSTGEARARRSDPATSHAAAKSVEDLNAKQLAVLEALRVGGETNDPNLVWFYRSQVVSKGDWPEQSESGIRTRRRELVDAGFVVDTQRRVTTDAGRDSIVWAVA